MKALLLVLAACVLAASPAVAKDKKKNKVSPHEFTITKKSDKASPQLAEAHPSATPRTNPAPTPMPYPAKTKKAKVSSGVLNGKAITKPQPAYPAIAK